MEIPIELAKDIADDLITTDHLGYPKCASCKYCVVEKNLFPCTEQNCRRARLVALIEAAEKEGE